MAEASLRSPGAGSLVHHHLEDTVGGGLEALEGGDSILGRFADDHGVGDLGEDLGAEFVGADAQGVLDFAGLLVDDLDDRAVDAGNSEGGQVGDGGAAVVVLELDGLGPAGERAGPVVGAGPRAVEAVPVAVEGWGASVFGEASADKSAELAFRAPRAKSATRRRRVMGSEGGRAG